MEKDFLKALEEAIKNPSQIEEKRNKYGMLILEEKETYEEDDCFDSYSATYLCNDYKQLLNFIQTHWDDINHIDAIDYPYSNNTEFIIKYFITDFICDVDIYVKH